MLTTGYLREQSVKFHELAAAARRLADQEHYGALSKVYECLAATLLHEADIIRPQSAQDAA